ncbi:MAG: helix-turn-helix transcriptional regulator [Desulfovermiculus sp.]|nr:helix-turn-helix transcriptional regulator [Desulfovermiculus sp.]
MLEHTKKPRTEVSFCGSPEDIEKLVRYAQELGVVDTTDSIPWRDAFPEVSDQEMPGYVLAGARGKEDMSQHELARRTGIPQRHISEMENGKRTIGKSTAMKLAEVLNVDYRVFL